MQKSKGVLPMRASDVQQRLDCRYGAQPDLIGCFYLFGIIIGRTFYRLQLLLQLQRFATVGISFLLEVLDGLRQLALFLLGLRQSILYLLEFGQQGFSFCR
jgi:hypothetical protein